MGATVTKYKGKPILSIPTGTAYHFSFGKVKAQLILQYLDDIYEFAGIAKPNNGAKPHKPKKASAKQLLPCWYCGDGHKQTAKEVGGHAYQICNGCGASIIPKLGKPSNKRSRGANYKLAQEVAAIIKRNTNPEKAARVKTKAMV
jgi:hypothetical protein